MILPWFLLCLVGHHLHVHGADTFECPADSGTFPHPDTDTRFYRCVDGNPVLHICTGGTFVPSQGLCLEVEKQTTSTSGPTLTTEESTATEEVRTSTAIPLSTSATSSPAFNTTTASSATTTTSPAHTTTQNTSSTRSATEEKTTTSATPSLASSSHTPSTTASTTGAVLISLSPETTRSPNVAGDRHDLTEKQMNTTAIRKGNETIAASAAIGHSDHADVEKTTERPAPELTAVRTTVHAQEGAGNTTMKVDPSSTTTADTTQQSHVDSAARTGDEASHTPTVPQTQSQHDHLNQSAVTVSQRSVTPSEATRQSEGDDQTTPAVETSQSPITPAHEPANGNHTDTTTTTTSKRLTLTSATTQRNDHIAIANQTSPSPTSTTPSEKQNDTTFGKEEAGQKPQAETFRAFFDHDTQDYDRGHTKSEDPNHWSGEGESFTCPQETGFFRHPTNCTRFYWCIGSLPTAMFCSIGTAFDPEASICAWAVGPDGCGGKLSAPTHHAHQVHDVRNDDVSLPDDVKIVAYRAESETEGDHWDSSDSEKGSDRTPRREGRFEPSHTHLTAEAQVYQCPGDGFYADPNDCSIFYHCSVGKAYRHRCQPGTAFNKDKLVCSWPLEKDGCGGMLAVPFIASLLPQSPPHLPAPHNQDTGFTCPDHLVGYYPDPDDCTVFYRCAEGASFKHECGNGTAFNKENGVCSWPLDLETGCGSVLGKIPDESKLGPGQPEKKTKDQPTMDRNGRDAQGSSRAVDKQSMSWNSRNFDVQKEDPNIHLTHRRPLSTGRKSSTDRRDKGNQKPTRYLTPRPRKSFLIVGERPDSRMADEPIARKSNEPLMLADEPIRRGDVGTGREKVRRNIYRASVYFDTATFSSLEPRKTHPEGGNSGNRKPTEAKDGSKPAVSTFDVAHSHLHSKELSLEDSDSGMADSHSKTRQKASPWPWEKVEKKKQKKRSSQRTAVLLSSVEASTDGRDSDINVSTTQQSVSTTDTGTASSAPDSTTTNEVTTETTPPTVTTSAKTAVTTVTSTTTTTSQPEEAERPVKAETYRVTGADTDFRCPFPTGHFRDPMNCAVYYHCTDSVPYRRDCPTGHLYDVNQHTCLPIPQVKDCRRVDERNPDWEEQWLSTYPEMGSYPEINEVSDGFECEELNGFFQHAQDCTAYVECIDGVPYTRHCMSDTVFDVSRKKCTWSSLVPDCRMAARSRLSERNLEADQFQCPSADGYYRDPFSCATYYHCIDGRAMARQCDPNFFFDPRASTCRWEKLVSDCDPNGYPIAREKLPLSSFVCPLPNGHFPDPEDCSVFYHCLRDVPYRGACRPHHAFDVSKMTCVPRAEVPGCKVIGVTDRETEEEVGEEGREPDRNLKISDGWRPDVSKQRNGVEHDGNDMTTEPVARFECPKIHGLYRDPEDCRFFYHCFAGRHFRHECQFGTVFSTERKLCTWPLLVPECQGVTQDLQMTSQFPSTTEESLKPETDRELDTVEGEHHHNAPTLTTLFSNTDDVTMNLNDVTHLHDDTAEDTTDVNSVAESKEGFVESAEQQIDATNQFWTNTLLLTAPLPPEAVPSDDDSDFICPPAVFDQYFRDPLDCTRFHRCVKGHRFTFDCPRGTFFDPEYSICDFQNKVGGCDHEGSRLGSSRQPLISYGNVPFQTFTGKGGERMSERAPGFPASEMCPKSDGLFPHPSSCRQFVYCSRGAPVVLTCPADLLYNTHTMTCDYDENTVCIRYDK